MEEGRMPAGRFTPDDIASVSVEHLGTVTVVRVSGEIDGSTEDVVGEPLFTCLRTTSGAVVIDLSNVEFIGSTGLNMLVRACETARSQVIPLRIVAGTRPVLRTLQVSGLDTCLPVSRSVPDALSVMGAAAETSR
jgi:anti-anti-sigma factor